MRFLSRRSLLSSSTVCGWSSSTFFVPSSPQAGPALKDLPPAQRLPEWMSLHEKSLLNDIVQEHSFTSLIELQKTSFQRIRDCISSSKVQIILIGDATHGTQEFYEIRSELTKALIQDGIVDAVMCEGDVGPFVHVNRYVVMSEITSSSSSSSGPSGGLNNAMDYLNNRFPTWMWGNNVMREFVSWMREYNKKSVTRREAPIQLLGMDIYSLFESIEGVLDYLKRYGSEMELNLVQTCYKALQSFQPDPKLYATAVFNNVVEAQEENVRLALNVLERHEAKLHASFVSQSQEMELFYALQNARAVKSAEAYFRLSANPSDKRQNAIDMWNLRDGAFLENVQHTIAFLKRQKSEIKAPVCVVVWAHNSHVGDANATDHSAKGYANLCSMCRREFGIENVYSIGMTTYKGSVRASKEWGDPDGVVKFTEAFEGSHEYFLHVIAQGRRGKGFGFSLTERCEYIDSKAQKLFDVNRLERFVGVSYAPTTELRSHYGVCNLSRQFDYLIHIDKSTALRVNSVSKGRQRMRSRKMDNALEDLAATEWDSMLLDKYGSSTNYVDLFERSENRESE